MHHMHLAVTLEGMYDFGMIPEIGSALCWRPGMTEGSLADLLTCFGSPLRHRPHSLTMFWGTFSLSKDFQFIQLQHCSQPVCETMKAKHYIVRRFVFLKDLLRKTLWQRFQFLAL